jgi:hypothetical protein
LYKELGVDEDARVRSNHTCLLECLDPDM